MLDLHISVGGDKYGRAFIYCGQKLTFVGFIHILQRKAVFRSRSDYGQIGAVQIFYGGTGAFAYFFQLFEKLPSDEKRSDIGTAFY